MFGIYRNPVRTVGRRTLMLVVSLVIAACSSQSASIPRYDDPDGFRAVMRTLSPWADGSPDRSRDGATPAEPGSDRAVFDAWVQRYQNRELFHQHDKDYVPFPVPSSVAGALRDQRAYEAENSVREAAEQAADDKNRAASLAAVARDSALHAQEREAAAAEQAAASAAAEIENARLVEQQATVAAAREDCATRRQAAAQNADPADYQKVYSSFPVCEQLR